ncbi:hypothetical protein L1785_12340 [Antribacter sp. KLBMP9083]|uniref:Uncharacterized protein n=1 Tax=Antribacter soli TaxID=2910976 RepID=A0AA41U7V1_9MICO|nr:hypothetical protein [Antribacter soli]MCF4121770.1 hypothetical protein [Antribacter soli]
MWRWARPAGALALVLGVLAGCGDGSPGAPPSGTPTSQSVPYTLLTHCGIDEVMHDGRWYERVGGRLDDGSGNPPPGWDNPVHEGLLVVEGDTAIFTDDAGHREVFRLREGATDFKSLCM